MSKFYSGIDGSLSVDGVKLGKARNWQFSTELEALDTTTLGDSQRYYRGGRQQSGGSCVLFWYAKDNGQLDGKPLIGALIQTGTVDPTKKYKLRLGSASMVVEVDALITSASVEAQPGQVMAAQLAFVACGPLTEVNLGGL